MKLYYAILVQSGFEDHFLTDPNRYNVPMLFDSQSRAEKHSNSLVFGSTEKDWKPPCITVVPVELEIRFFKKKENSLG